MIIIHFQSSSGFFYHAFLSDLRAWSGMCVNLSAVCIVSSRMCWFLVGNELGMCRPCSSPCRSTSILDTSTSTSTNPITSACFTTPAPLLDTHTILCNNLTLAYSSSLLQQFPTQPLASSFPSSPRSSIKTRSLHTYPSHYAPNKTFNHVQGSRGHHHSLRSRHRPRRSLWPAPADLW